MEKTTQISREDFLKSLKPKEGDPCLVIMQGENKGKKFLLNKPLLTVGRTSDSDLSLADPSVSRNHAKIEINSAEVVVQDIGSSNGTFINKIELKKNATIKLERGDMIQFGHVILKFLPAGEVETDFLTEMTKQAHIDALTEAFNKGYLKQYGDTEFKKVRALGENWSVIFIDLDHFKKVNDTYGHAAGDHVLKEFSAIIRSSLRVSDLFARYGGEEFVLLLGKTSVTTAFVIADRLRKRVEAHEFIFEGTRILVTSSAGVTELKPVTKSFDELLKAADGALYRAKETGRNRVCVAE